MRYRREITLKNGAKCVIRSCEFSDGEAVYKVFELTHGETDYLLAYPDENSFTVAQEQDFLKNNAESQRSLQLCAEIDGKIVGLASLEPMGDKFKIRHRAEIGISILKDFWGLGIGRMMIDAVTDCAKSIGITSLELQVVSQNSRAVSLYASMGFREFGRNPRGFKSRNTGYQELTYMLLELN